MRKVFIKAVCPFALTSSASAGDVCPTLATGTWRIVSVKNDPITAMSNQEARAFVGQKIIVSEHEVIFGKLRCEVVKEVVTYTKEEDRKEFSAQELYVPGYPYGVSYDCRDRALFIPGFDVGKSCDKILSGLDGWTFFLRRSK